jgi:hypothetical protein
VVVVNRLGAGGTIGIASIFNGPADGYQLVMGGLGSVVFTSAVYKGRLSYDPVKDLLPVGVVGSAPSVITVRASLNVKTLAELIALAKANPDKLSFGSAGVGGALHVAGVLLEKEAGISLNHIPYKGGAPAINDLAAGVVDIALADLTLIKPVLQGERVRPLTIATGERSACSSLGLHARPMPPACAPALKNVVRVSSDLGTVGQPHDCFACKAFARNSVKHWRCDIDSIRNANTIDHSRCVFHIGHVEARVRVVKPAIRVNDVSVWHDLEAIA